MASFLPHHHGSLLDRERKLSSVLALKSSLRQREATPEEAVAAGPEVACGGGADRAVFADGFSVEDFLDIEGLCEVDKDCADTGDDVAPEPEPEPGTAEVEDKNPSDYHVSSSVVPYELMTLPGHDAEELEWVSRIVDDSLADPPPQTKLPAGAFVASARRPLDGTAAASRNAMRRRPTAAICAPSTEALVPLKGGRAKRSRAPVWSLSGETTMSKSAVPSFAATTIRSYCVTSSPSSSRLLLPKAAVSSPVFMSSSHYYLDDETSRRANKKSQHVERGSKSGGKPSERGHKRKKHHPRPGQFTGGGCAYAQAGKHGDRRCSHCGVQKTPQWRAGPEGPKTLCNACGVRYKSGRLLPEYRPACSPTFVSSVHSNFHRRVLEIRCQKEGCHDPVPVPAAADAALLDLGPAVASFKPAAGEKFY